MPPLAHFSRTEIVEQYKRRTHGLSSLSEVFYFARLYFGGIRGFACNLQMGDDAQTRCISVCFAAIQRSVLWLKNQNLFSTSIFGTRKNPARTVSP